MATESKAKRRIRVETETDSGERPSRRTLLRDLLIFQMKLWMDGLKDIVLSPLSIIATVLDVLFYNRTRRSTLYTVLRLGEKYDLWLNLYGAAEKAGSQKEGLLGPEGADDRPSLDDLLRRNPELVKDAPAAGDPPRLERPDDEPSRSSEPSRPPSTSRES